MGGVTGIVGVASYMSLVGKLWSVACIMSAIFFTCLVGVVYSHGNCELWFVVELDDPHLSDSLQLLLRVDLTNKQVRASQNNHQGVPHPSHHLCCLLIIFVPPVRCLWRAGRTAA